MEVDGRREVSSRNASWAKQIARKLAQWNIAPNQISMASVFFAVVGAVVLLYSVLCGTLSFYISFPIYILCIQLRLLCNLFDGMVAIEGGKKSSNGYFFNDIPDRFADALLIVPAGYVVGSIGVELGWLAAILAVMTAYFRWIGAYKTKMHYFCGPMAKQHRMALLTCMALVGIATINVGYYPLVFLVGLILMNIGLCVTLARRLYLMSHSKTEEKES